jgi:transposase InsO family protein
MTEPLPDEIDDALWDEACRRAAAIRQVLMRGSGQSTAAAVADLAFEPELSQYTREALMIRVDRKLNSTDVLDALTDRFILRGPPEYIRSDNGPESVAQKGRDWIAAVGAKTAFIEPASPS